MRKTFGVCASLVVFGMFAVPEGFAQEATSFEQLQVLVEPGDTVTVVEPSGARTKGRVSSLSGSSLSLRAQAQGMIREFAERDVAEVRQRRGDSLKNGALIGAIAGAGGMGILMAVFCGDCGRGDVAATLGIYGGMGAAAGVGIDALIVREKVVYRPRSRVTVVPDVRSGRRAVLAQMSF